MTPDLNDPPGAVLDILTRAALERKSPWRWPVLASRGRDFPSARILVVRGFDRAAREIELHTDRRSAKCADLSADPACALLFFDAGSMVQLGIEGRAELLTDADADAAFARAPNGSLADYRGRAPGDDPDAPASAHSDDARANFAAIRVSVERADLLALSRSGHERRFIDFRTAVPSWRRAEP